jgi:hypothetical protein
MTILDVETFAVVVSSMVVTPEKVKLVKSGVRVMSYRVGLMVRGRRTRPAALLLLLDDDAMVVLLSMII